MHLGLVIYGTLETVSGGYLYDRMLVEHLQSCGDHVELISLPWRNYAQHLGQNCSARLYRRLASFKGDLLLQDELNHPSLFWLNRRLKPFSGFPILSIVHHLRSQEQHSSWRNLFYRWIERLYLQTADGFIFNSQTTLQTVMKIGIELSRTPHLVAVPAGDRFNPQITPEQILQRAFEPGPLRVIFLGNLIPRKGLHTLLEAIRLLPHETCLLTVVGNPQVDPHYTRSILERIDRSDLKNRVEMRGVLTVKELSELFHSRQVLAVPSQYEGYGIVYLEGMSFGLPAVATTAGAAHEIITEGRDGFLIPPQDVQTLANRLGALAADRPLLAKMGLAARRRFEEQPGWNQTTAAIRRFLLSLTTGRQNSSV